MFAPTVRVVPPYVLNDGRAVEIRPIQPDDGERLHDHHERLSPQSRYRRFLATKPHLSAADARYLVQIDGCDHFALVATAQVDGADGAFVGVARFIRLTDQPDTAEFAIVVADEYQRHGLARELLGRLAAAARHRGVTRFRAAMLADNVAVRRLMAELAMGEVKSLRSGSVIELEIELPESGNIEITRAGGPRKVDVSVSGNGDVLPTAA
jgi:RimJ/RimL family protein N-acetyltransferase